MAERWVPSSRRGCGGWVRLARWLFCFSSECVELGNEECMIDRYDIVDNGNDVQLGLVGELGAVTIGTVY